MSFRIAVHKDSFSSASRKQKHSGQDLTGQVFGLWTVIARAPSGKRGDSMSLVKCRCGTERILKNADLRIGHTNSCGCTKSRATTEAKTIHGASKPGSQKYPEYSVWNAMKNRCFNPNRASYANYGGRGITVCDRWKHSFQNFYEDMGPKPSPKHTIDRIDNDGNYEPSNCRWITWDVQNNNRRPRRSRAEIEMSRGDSP